MSKAALLYNSIYVGLVICCIDVCVVTVFMNIPSPCFSQTKSQCIFDVCLKILQFTDCVLNVIMTINRIVWRTIA